MTAAAKPTRKRLANGLRSDPGSQLGRAAEKQGATTARKRLTREPGEIVRVFKRTRCHLSTAGEACGEDAAVKVNGLGICASHWAVVESIAADDAAAQRHGHAGKRRPRSTRRRAPQD